MSAPFDDRDPWEDYMPYTCHDCDGEGLRLICPDDMCRGSGECLHGDGYVPCWTCGGSGEVEP